MRLAVSPRHTGAVMIDGYEQRNESSVSLRFRLRPRRSRIRDYYARWTIINIIIERDAVSSISQLALRAGAAAALAV